MTNDELDELDKHLRYAPYVVMAHAADALAKLRAENERLTAANEALEKLRPVWAMGYSDDSVAAQASTAALVQLWARLGAVDQTDAILKLQDRGK